jgi:hypothetical protein
MSDRVTVAGERISGNGARGRDRGGCDGDCRASLPNFGEP